MRSADDHDHDHDHDDDHGHDHDGGHRHDHHRRGVAGLIRGLFSPHSHDTVLEPTSDGMRALKISLVALAVTAALQVGVVLFSGSVALLADTVHNGTDALTAIPLGIAFWLGRRPPSKRYTHGYGRAEDLAGVFIVLTIAASAAFAAWEAIQRLRHPEDVENVGWVIVAGLIGFAGNELVAVYRIRVGERIGSAALVADGLHARTDGLTSLAVVLGAIGVSLGWQAADPVVGLVITAVILLVLRSAARDVYRRLMDSVDPELVDQVTDVAAAVAGVESVDGVRIRWIGHELHAEIDVTVDRDLDVASAHAITEEVEHSLLHEVPRFARATVHADPCTHDGSDPHASIAHHH